MDIESQKDGAFLLDTWQWLIVMNANSEYPGLEGNWPGDECRYTKVLYKERTFAGDRGERKIPYHSSGY